MPHYKDFAWTHCIPITGSTKIKCNWHQSEISGEIYHFKYHLENKCEKNNFYKICPADVTFQAKQALDSISKDKAKKARTGIGIRSNSADVQSNRLDGEDGAHEYFGESRSTPSIAHGPNKVEKTLMLSLYLVLHQDQRPL